MAAQTQSVSSEPLHVEATLVLIQARQKQAAGKAQRTQDSQGIFSIIPIAECLLTIQESPDAYPIPKQGLLQFRG